MLNNYPTSDMKSQPHSIFLTYIHKIVIKIHDNPRKDRNRQKSDKNLHKKFTGTIPRFLLYMPIQILLDIFVLPEVRMLSQIFLNTILRLILQKNGTFSKK